jgi:5-methylcytosine-specific restriction endonuclease McrA
MDTGFCLCHEKCMRTHERGHTDFICPVCSKKFSRQNRHVRKIKTICCCSRECAGFWKRGERNACWKGGISRRGAAIQKAVRKSKQESGSCSRCGAKENLHGHHVKPVSTHPHLAASQGNIIVLCSQCHGDEHPKLRGALTIPRSRSGKEIVCVICEKRRYVMPSVLALGKGDCCSRACRNVLYARKFKSDPVKFGVAITCVYCSRLHYVSRCQASRAKFCSRTCKHKARQANLSRCQEI